MNGRLPSRYQCAVLAAFAGVALPLPFAPAQSADTRDLAQAPASQGAAPLAAPDVPNADAVELKGLAARPDAAGRLVRMFTFDEDTTNPGEVPLDWYRDIDSPTRSLPGFPSWNRAKLVYANEGGTPMRGTGALELPIAGGSSALVLSSGVLPVFGNADYLVSAFVRTDGLQHARAGVVTQVLDSAGNVIPGTLSASELITTNGAWKEVIASISIDDPKAAFIQLRLVALQPQEAAALFPQPQRASAAFTVHAQDLAGRALFDDVSVLQLPRLDITPAETGGVMRFASNAKPFVKVRTVVRDLTGEQLRLETEVLDTMGKVIATRPSQVFQGQHASEWTVEVPRAGWYRARVRVSGPSGRVVGGSVADMLTIAAAAPTLQTDAWRMGLDLTDLPTRTLPLSPRMLADTGLSSATLPAWHADLRSDTIDEHTRLLGSVLGAMIMQRNQITLSLAPVPSQLAWDARVEVDDAWGLLQFPRHIWQGFADNMIEQLGERIEHWQLGGLGDQDPFWRANVAGEITSTAETLTQLAPGSTLHIPTSVERMWQPALAAIKTDEAVSLTASIAPTLPTAGLRASLAMLTDQLEGASIRLAFDARTMEGMDATTQQTQLAQHVIEAWRLLGDGSAQAGSGIGRAGKGANVAFTLAHPYRVPVAESAAKGKLHARPALQTWITLSRLLGDRRVVARLPVAVAGQDGSPPHASPHVVAYVLAPLDATSPRGGALVLWHEGPGIAQALLPAGLKALTAVDLEGNRTALTSREGRAGDARTLELAITDRPVFIEGVDVELLRFLSNVVVDPPSLDAALTTQDASILLTNPWQGSITGSVTILEPGGMQSGEKDRRWRIAPRTSAFSISPGGSARLPVSVGFSSHEEAGPKRFVLGISLEAEENYGVVQVERSVPLGLTDFSIDLSQVATSGGLVAVETVVTNTSDRTLSLELTALAPGTPRAKASIVNLPPGKQASRRFSFQARKIATPEVLVSVEDKEERTRLNKSVKLEGIAIAISSEPADAPAP
jgi:hypothetical protein